MAVQVRCDDGRMMNGGRVYACTVTADADKYCVTVDVSLLAAGLYGESFSAAKVVEKALRQLKLKDRSTLKVRLGLAQGGTITLWEDGRRVAVVNEPLTFSS